MVIIPIIRLTTNCQILFLLLTNKRNNENGIFMLEALLSPPITCTTQTLPVFFRSHWPQSTIYIQSNLFQPPLPQTGSPPHLLVQEQVGWGPRLPLPLPLSCLWSLITPSWRESSLGWSHTPAVPINTENEVRNWEKITNTTMTKYKMKTKTTTR